MVVICAALGWFHVQDFEDKFYGHGGVSGNFPTVKYTPETRYDMMIIMMMMMTTTTTITMVIMVMQDKLHMQSVDIS